MRGLLRSCNTSKHVVLSYALWPFDHPHYLILNVAVGGAWGGAKGIDESIFPQRMTVDYVRVYERP